MKNQNPICSLLGITQLQAAMLLQVSTSQWSMYESGKRDLPLRAKELLAEMLAYVRSREETAIRPDSETHTKQQQLERLLIENEYRQRLLARKVITANRKHIAQRRLSHLADFLDDREKNGKGDASYQSIISKAAHTTASDVNSDLVKYEFQKEILNLEKLHLERWMEEIRSGNIYK